VKRHPKQCGAAILVAMLVVTLVATLAAGLQWRQWRLLQQEAAARTQSQAAWVLVGALDWARLILREDARSAGNDGLIDHLGEPWALPLQEAKLASFLAADSLSEPRQDEAYLSGSIVDEQSKINLTNLLVNTSGQNALSPSMMASLARLYQQLGLPAVELKLWTSGWLASQPDVQGAQTAPSSQGNASVPLRPQYVEQLVWLGLPSSSLAALKDYLTILPQRTPINLNTASSVVIFASVPDIELATAQKLVQSRAQAPLKNVSDAQTVLGAGSALSATDFSVSTQFFQVRGRLRLGDWMLEESSLVRRANLDVTTIWRRRV
jgi:general secretion pathway protein K